MLVMTSRLIDTKPDDFENFIKTGKHLQFETHSLSYHLENLINDVIKQSDWKLEGKSVRIVVENNGFEATLVSGRNMPCGIAIHLILNAIDFSLPGDTVKFVLGEDNLI